MLALLLVALLSGCATVYTPKAGDPVARLRVVTAPTPLGVAAEWDSGLIVRDLSACPASTSRVLSSGVLRSGSTPNLGMPSPVPANKLSAEFAMPAGQPLAFAFIMSRGPLVCEVDARFTPLAGRDYEVAYLFAHAKRVCQAVVHELKPTSRGVERVKLAGVRPLKVDQHCEAGPVTK